MENSEAFRPVVVVGKQRHGSTCSGMGDRIRALGLCVIVVGEDVFSFQDGFRRACEAGYTHAATIESEGEFDVEQILPLLSLARVKSESLILGYRDDVAGVERFFGRVRWRIANVLVLLESGVRVRDSHCSVRVYPLGLIHSIACRAERYGFETEIIVRAGLAGCDIQELLVSGPSLPSGYRADHFSEWINIVRACGMHIRLLARALLPWGHKAVANRLSRQSVWEEVIEWINPARVWRELRQGGGGRIEVATGFAIGIFVANLPLYGVQTVLAIYAARRLHLHPAPVIAGSQISTPPIGPVMVASAIWLGHLMLHGSALQWHDMNFSKMGVKHLVGPLLADWAVGSVVLGLVMAVIGFAAIAGLFRLIQTDSATR